jgi:hypothetical protein
MGEKDLNGQWHFTDPKAAFQGKEIISINTLSDIRLIA